MKINKKLSKKILPLILAIVMALSACGTAAVKPEARLRSVGMPNLPREGALTIAQIADYLIHAADDYKGETDKAVLLKGMEGKEKEKATRMQALVLLSRAFGALPKPTGNNKRIAPPVPDLSDVPEWAESDLENLVKGGILLTSDYKDISANTYSSGTVDGANGADSIEPVADGAEPAADGDNPTSGIPAKVPPFVDEVDLAELSKLTARVFALYSNNLKDDFYNTVNKGDLDGAVIPAGQTQGGGSVAMQELVNSRVHEIVMGIVNSGKTYSKGSDEQKIKSFYENIMNAEQRNKEGLAPLNKFFEAIDGAKTVKELNAVNAQIVNALGKFSSGMINFYLSADIKDNTKKVITLLTPYGNLGAAEYQDPNNERHQQYKALVTELLTYAGESPKQVEVMVEQLFEMEAVMNAAIEKQDFSNINSHYNYMTAEELETLLPGIGMPEFFAAIGVKSSTGYSAESVELYKTFAQFLGEEYLPLHKARFKLNLLSAHNEYLGDKLQGIYESYYAGMGSAPTEKKPLEEQASETIGYYLENILAKLYVERYFPPEAKAGVESMAAELVQAFRERVGKLGWMNENTKKEALRKLDNLKILVGYSDDWGESPEIADMADGGTFFENMAEVSRLRLQEELLTQGEGKAETTFSSMSPLTVNAASNRTTNTIIMPAGTLLPPLFDVNASKEENLSGIGMIIAHEITHVFDDQGAQYDADGNLRDWWTEEDYKHFQTQINKVESFYTGFEIAPGAAVNGEASLSENISDIGGLACALEVLSKEASPDYDLFFRNYAKSWVRVAERKLTEGLGESDHAPVKARVNRVVSNFQEFFETYGINEGDGMYVAPEDRIAIW